VEDRCKRLEGLFSDGTHCEEDVSRIMRELEKEARASREQAKDDAEVEPGFTHLEQAAVHADYPKSFAERYQEAMRRAGVGKTF
jgi:hypothetical protein